MGLGTNRRHEDDRDALLEKIDALSSKVERLEKLTEALEAQLHFSEKALASCIEREESLRSAQTNLRSELLAKVHGLTTE